jgi:NitT/TauT family transport system ATP-binding protein
MACDRIAVLSAAPAVVKNVITVDVPRPRNFRSMRDPDFGRCMEKLWDLLRYDVDKAMRVGHPSDAGP